MSTLIRNIGIKKTLKRAFVITFSIFLLFGVATQETYSQRAVKSDSASVGVDSSGLSLEIVSSFEENEQSLSKEEKQEYSDQLEAVQNFAGTTEIGGDVYEAEIANDTSDLDNDYDKDLSDDITTLLADGDLSADEVVEYLTEAGATDIQGIVDSVYLDESVSYQEPWSYEPTYYDSYSPPYSCNDSCNSSCSNYNPYQAACGWAPSTTSITKVDTNKAPSVNSFLVENQIRPILSAVYTDPNAADIGLLSFRLTKAGGTKCHFTRSIKRS